MNFEGSASIEKIGESDLQQTGQKVIFEKCSPDRLVTMLKLFFKKYGMILEGICFGSKYLNERSSYAYVMHK